MTIISNTGYPGVSLPAGGQLTITSTGGVNGASYGVSAATGSTLINSGAISGKYGVGDYSATVTNNGYIYGYFAAIQASGGVITNTSTGRLIGVAYGVRGNSVQVYNQGTISGPLYGVSVSFSSITNSGYISGAITGVTGNNDTVENSGTITGGVQVNSSSTVTNSGSITGGVQVNGTSAITNTYTGSISSSTDIGVSAVNSSTVTNAGAIYGTNYGVYANASTVLNTGSISASGAGIDAIASTATNSSSGVIYGRAIGVLAQTGSTVTNYGSITGGIGVRANQYSTVTNSGTIAGSAAAVVLTDHSTLNVLSGAVFEGAVTDDGTGILNLAGTAAGALDMGGSFSGFENISFGSASWTLAGTTSELANGESISGFGSADRLVLEGFEAVAETFVSGIGLELKDASGTQIVIGFADSTSTSPYVFLDTADGTQITMCFLAGTRIATPAGETPIEDLRAGDLVLTAAGQAVQVRWLGVSAVATRFADPLRSLPIRIKAGALGEALPRRDLLVSPDHAMYLDGILVQAGALVNGVTILRERAMPEHFCYYHLETAAHELVLAEGAATETFVDNAERRHFDNWAEYEALHGQGIAVPEMQFPRAKSARQIPPSLRRLPTARVNAMSGTGRVSAA